MDKMFWGELYKSWLHIIIVADFLLFIVLQFVVSGIEVKFSKPHMESAARSYHISNAALDLNSLENTEKFTQIWVQTSQKNVLLATLSIQTPAIHLDHAFDTGEPAKYLTVGPGTVYLSGYYIPSESNVDYSADESIAEMVEVRRYDALH